MLGSKRQRSELSANRWVVRTIVCSVFAWPTTVVGGDPSAVEIDIYPDRITLCLDDFRFQCEVVELTKENAQLADEIDRCAIHMRSGQERSILSVSTDLKRQDDDKTVVCNLSQAHAWCPLIRIRNSDGRFAPHDRETSASFVVCKWEERRDSNCERGQQLYLQKQDRRIEINVSAYPPSVFQWMTETIPALPEVDPGGKPCLALTNRERSGPLRPNQQGPPRPESSEPCPPNHCNCNSATRDQLEELVADHKLWADTQHNEDDGSTTHIYRPLVYRKRQIENVTRSDRRNEAVPSRDQVTGCIKEAAELGTWKHDEFFKREEPIAEDAGRYVVVLTARGPNPGQTPVRLKEIRQQESSRRTMQESVRRCLLGIVDEAEWELAGEPEVSIRMDDNAPPAFVFRCPQFRAREIVRRTTSTVCERCAQVECAASSDWTEEPSCEDPRLEGLPMSDVPHMRASVLAEVLAQLTGRGSRQCGAEEDQNLWYAVPEGIAAPLYSCVLSPSTRNEPDLVEHENATQ